jgi:hypothetical protein
VETIVKVQLQEEAQSYADRLNGLVAKMQGCGLPLDQLSVEGDGNTLVLRFAGEQLVGANVL